MKENEIAAVVVDSAFRLHAGLGPGIFEIVYEVSLVHELRIAPVNARNTPERHYKDGCWSEIAHRATNVR